MTWVRKQGSAANLDCTLTSRVVTCVQHQELGRRPSQPAYPGKVEQDMMGSLRGNEAGQASTLRSGGFRIFRQLCRISIRPHGSSPTNNEKPPHHHVSGRSRDRSGHLRPRSLVWRVPRRGWFRQTAMAGRQGEVSLLGNDFIPKFATRKSRCSECGGRIMNGQPILQSIKGGKVKKTGHCSDARGSECLFLEA